MSEEIVKRSNRIDSNAVSVDGGKLVGYAAVWDAPAFLKVAGKEIVEVTRRGAFVDSLGGDIVATFNHDEASVLGRTSSGTLTLFEDDRGLRYTITLGDTVTAQEVAKMVARGDVRGSSWMGAILDGPWTSANRREIRKVQLVEVGPVTFPAYPSTSVSLRSTNETLRLKLGLRLRG